MLVGPGEVEDLLSAESVEPGDEVGGHGVVGVTDVGHVVRVVDRGGDVEDVAAHGRVMVPAARAPDGPRAPFELVWLRLVEAPGVAADQPQSLEIAGPPIGEREVGRGIVVRDLR